MEFRCETGTETEAVLFEVVEAGLRKTSTVMGSEAVRKAATASSWELCETSRPFTCKANGKNS